MMLDLKHQRASGHASIEEERLEYAWRSRATPLLWDTVQQTCKDLEAKGREAGASVPEAQDKGKKERHRRCSGLKLGPELDRLERA